MQKKKFINEDIPIGREIAMLRVLLNFTQQQFADTLHFVFFMLLKNWLIMQIRKFILQTPPKTYIIELTYVCRNK